MNNPQPECPEISVFYAGTRPHCFSFKIVTCCLPHAYRVAFRFREALMLGLYQRGCVTEDEYKNEDVHVMRGLPLSYELAGMKRAIKKTAPKDCLLT